MVGMSHEFIKSSHITFSACDMYHSGSKIASVLLSHHYPKVKIAHFSSMVILLGVLLGYILQYVNIYYLL